MRIHAKPLPTNFDTPAIRAAARAALAYFCDPDTELMTFPINPRTTCGYIRVQPPLGITIQTVSLAEIAPQTPAGAEMRARAAEGFLVLLFDDMEQKRHRLIHVRCEAASVQGPGAEA